MKKYLRYIVLMLLSINLYGFTFSPLNFDKRVDSDGAFQEFFIRNDSKKTMKYQINALSNEKENDISQYIKIYPKVITVDPLSNGSFKVFAEDDVDIPKGELGFMLDIKSLKVPDLQNVGEKENNSSVEFKLNLNLEMFAYKGEVGNEFIITEDEFYRTEEGEKRWKATIKNENGRGYELAIGFLDRMEYIYGLENISRLFNGNATKVDVKIPKEAKYIIFWDHNNMTTVGQKIKIK